MPKELTHWWLADQTISQLHDTSTIKILLNTQQSAYLIGSVLPDTLLHLVIGADSQTALELAGRFHEPVGNSFTPLIRFIEQHPVLSPVQEACLLGVASHMLADIVFHPFVCAVAGTDLGEHYRIETELDLWLLHEGKRPQTSRMKDLVKDAAAAGVIPAVMQELFDPEQLLPTATFETAIRLHSLIQGMYGTVGWQLVASGLAKLPSSFLRSRYKLFYPFRWHHGRARNWPISWSDPARGEYRHETPDQLLTEAIQRTIALFLTIEQQGIHTALQNQPGENLVTGLKPIC